MMRLLLGLIALIAAASSSGVGLVTQSGPRCFGCTGGSGAATALAQAAASLGAGQSMKFGTIPEAVIETDGSGFSPLQYMSSGVYDSAAKRIKWIGKRSSTFQYRQIAYDEASNTWSVDADLYPGATSPQNGHGYDQNALDTATGDYYFRPYNDLTVYKWASGTWSALPDMANEDDAASLSWFPGVGLIYVDCRLVRKFAGGSWTDIQTGFAASQNHTVSEYNPNSNILIFGAGNCSSTLRKMTSAQVVSTIATAPVSLGSSELQGLLCADPAGQGFVGWDKGGGGWAHYNPGTDAWSTLTQASTDTATPANGTPQMNGGSAHTACIVIIPYGIIMFLQYQDGVGANVRLYKHTAP